MFSVILVQRYKPVWVNIAVQVDVELVNGDAVLGGVFFSSQALAGGQCAQHHFNGIDVMGWFAAAGFIHLQAKIPY
jgi:hypothetical protein